MVPSSYVDYHTREIETATMAIHKRSEGWRLNTRHMRVLEVRRGGGGASEKIDICWVSVGVWDCV